MAEAIPQPQDCCTTCDEQVEVAIPGAQGAQGDAGDDGDDGDDGLSCCSETTAQFTVPAEGATVVLTVTENRMHFIGQLVQIEGAGWYEVTAVPGGITTSMTVENIADAANGVYPDNAVAGTVIASGALICPGGPQGPEGPDCAPDNATYWVRTASAGLTSETVMGALASGYVKVTTATGVPSTVTEIPDEDIEYDEQVIAAAAIDWSLGRTFYKLLAANTAFTFSNTVGGKQILVVVRQGNGASWTATFPGTVKWASATAPTMTTTSLAYAVFSFYKCNVTGDIIGTVLNDAY